MIHIKAWLYALLLSLCSVFAPAKAMFISSLALIAADLITGIMASRKQGIPITSSALRRTIVKALVYEAAIALAFIAEVYLLDGTIAASKIIAGMVGITELKSCLENLDILGGGGLLKSIIEKLGSENKP